MTNPRETEHNDSLLGHEVTGTNGAFRFVGRLIGISPSTLTIHFGGTNLNFLPQDVELYRLHPESAKVAVKRPPVKRTTAKPVKPIPVVTIDPVVLP